MGNHKEDSTHFIKPQGRKLKIICVYLCASVVLLNHPGFHIIPSVTPSGFDFVGESLPGISLRSISVCNLSLLRS